MNASARLCVLTFTIVFAAILLSAWLVTFFNAQGSAELLRSPFRLLCHGRTERALHFWNTPMPICSRCVGIYSGATMALLTFSIRARSWRREFPGFITIALILPLVLDGASQALGLRESTNDLRLLTGILTGIGGMAWIVSRLPRVDELSIRQLPRD